MIPKAEFKGFFINGKIEEVPVHWLIDTGSVLTIISKRKFEQIPAEERPKLEEYDRLLVAANDSHLKVHGQASFDILFGDEWYHHQLLVAEIRDEGIIGVDFLMQHGIVLDFAQNTVKCHDKQLEMSCHRTKERMCRIAVTEGVLVPPGARKIVEGRTTKPLAEGAWLIESTQQLPVKHSVLLARALVQGQGTKLPLELMNPTDESCYLYPGTHVGVASRVRSETLARSSTSHKQTSASLPAELQKLVDEVDAPLTAGQRERVAALMRNNRDVFSLPGEPPGRTNLVEHQIVVEAEGPIKQSVRRPPIHLKEAANEEVQKMLREGIIEPSNSPWASPVVLVRKKDGSLRYCIDYRKLNAVTRKDSYPLPRIDDSLDTLRSAKYFTTLDLASGYWQIELSEDAKQKSAFCTTTGLYQFKVMPFGLTNAPATFQRLMERVLAGLQWQLCLVYIDDIIIFSRTVEEHLQQLQTVFTRLKSAGLKLKPKKCHLFKQKVQYLGHIVSEAGIQTDPEKIQAVMEWGEPTTVTEVRSFLGLCSYYRKFVPEFATIARPLIKLTEKNCPFSWREEQREAWETLKQCLTSAPILGYPDPAATFILDTDASDYGIGAVLSQVKDGEEQVIAYGSRALTKPERRYCVTRKELLAVVYFTRYFRHYLLGKRFVLRTDHAPLRWLKSFREPEGQVARWLEALQSFDFDLVHRPGKNHQNADALSRGPCFQCGGGHEGEKIRGGKIPGNAEEEEKTCAVQTRSRAERQARTKTWFQSEDVNMEQFQAAQEADPVLAMVRTWVQQGKRPEFVEISSEGREIKFYWGQFDSLLIRDGLLVREVPRVAQSPKTQILVPHSMRREILEQSHDVKTAGHLGKHKTIANVKGRFLWPGMRVDAELFVRTCDLCAMYKTSGKQRRAGMKTFQVGEPMERLCIDIAGPFPETSKGSKYTVIVTDWFTKFVEIYSVPNQEAVTIAEVIVRNYISRFGVPREIHTDQGRQFEAELFQEMCALLGIKKTRTTSFHPQSDGQSERNIKTLTKMLAIAANQQPDWDDYLPYIAMAYRATPQASTGFSPNFLMFGRELAMPIDVMLPLQNEDHATQGQYATKMRERLHYAYDVARKVLKKSVERQKRLYNERVFGEPHRVGDLVWCADKTRKKGVSPKLQPKWKGPGIITEVFNDVVVKVQFSPKKMSILHVDLLKPCHTKKLPFWMKKLQKRLAPQKPTPADMQ